MYAIAQGHAMVAAGLANRALVVGGDVLSKLMNWNDRSTCILFGDGAGAVVLERVKEGGFLGFELGADGAGGVDLLLPAGGSRLPASPETVGNGGHYVQMNGREVFKFATRVLVSSAEAVLAECGSTIEDVDVYVPHQANVRIIDHATKKLGIDPEPRRRERRPLREHVFRFNSAGAGRCADGRAAARGEAGVDDWYGRGPYVGLGFARMDGATNGAR